MDRYSNEKFKEIVQNNNSFKSVMSALGYNSNSGDSKAQLLKKNRVIRNRYFSF